MNPVTSLSLGRIAVGVASLAKPELVATVLGTPSSPTLMTQWFGSREIAIGAATLLARGSARRNLVLVGVAVDGADAATALAAVTSETLPKPLGYGMVGVALGAVVSGLLGLRVKRTVQLATVCTGTPRWLRRSRWRPSRNHSPHGG